MVQTATKSVTFMVLTQEHLLFTLSKEKTKKEEEKSSSIYLDST